MANIHPDITPTGLNQREEVELMAMIMKAIQGLATKLDADGGVNSTTYLANAYTAGYANVIVEDRQGNRYGAVTDAKGYVISPNGITDAARLQWMYSTYYALYIICTQLDDDTGVTDTNYEALVYNVYCSYRVTPNRYNNIGYGTDFTFGPGGALPMRELVDFYYDLVKGFEVLAEKLDDDGGVTDTTYEALWFTAVILLKVQDSAGNVAGNARTDM